MLMSNRQYSAPPEAIEAVEVNQVTKPAASVLLPPRKADRQYFLHVELEVAAENRDAFVAKAVGLLGDFKVAGLDLKASGWRTDSDPIRVFNCWDMGSDADALLEAELMLPDVPDFSELMDLIQHEVKNIVVPLAGRDRVALPAGRMSRDYRYLRALTHVKSEDLAEFTARVEERMEDFTTKQGWFLGETFYGVTGNAGIVSQLWVVPHAESTQVAKLLKAAPWFDRDQLKNGLKLGDTKLELFEASPSDPNFAAEASL